MRRRATRVRKLHTFQKDMLRLPATTPERPAVRGDQDRPEAPRSRGGKCATTQPRAHPAAPQASDQVSATEYTAHDTQDPNRHDDVIPPFHEPL
jgi:hypothetical protein